MEANMDVFELLQKGDTAGLKAALDADPAVAMTRNAAGASLLAVAAYYRNPDAIAAVRAALPMIDPYEAIIIGGHQYAEGRGHPCRIGGAQHWHGRAIAARRRRP
jgi:hypothetical protein